MNILQVKAELEHLFKIELEQDDQGGKSFSYELETKRADYLYILHEVADSIRVIYEIYSHTTRASFSCSENIEYIGKLETFYDKVQELNKIAKQYL